MHQYTEHFKLKKCSITLFSGHNVYIYCFVMNSVSSNIILKYRLFQFLLSGIIRKSSIFKNNGSSNKIKIYCNRKYTYVSFSFHFILNMFLRSLKLPFMLSTNMIHELHRIICQNVKSVL